jgi:hypothetical protein
MAHALITTLDRVQFLDFLCKKPKATSPFIAIIREDAASSKTTPEQKTWDKRECGGDILELSLCSTVVGR